MKTRGWLPGFLVLLLACAPLSAQELQRFLPGSYQAIVDARGARPFVLALWSVDCPPCYAELKMLGELQRSQPFDLVLVSTDAPGTATEASRVLGRFGLDANEAWIFAAPTARLRFEIDRSWYGELPRSYLFMDGQREAVTGALEAATLRACLERSRR